MRLYNTKSIKAGSLLRQDLLKLDLKNAYDLSSDIIRIDIPNSPDIGNKIKVIAEDPFPCSILSIALRGNTYD